MLGRVPRAPTGRTPRSFVAFAVERIGADGDHGYDTHAQPARSSRNARPGTGSWPCESA